jgi:ABC-2 family transporter protein
MIWLTWRQFRAQSIAAAAALTATAIVLGLTGVHLAHLYATTGVAGCHAGGCVTATARFVNLLNAGFANHLPLLFGTALIVVPAIIGIFWGAPLITRELETGTSLLVWNQSVSRSRWLATKLAIVGLASMAAAGLFSLLVTWSASRIDKVNMNWLQPSVFSERGIVPIGYAAFAFALGVLTGILIRRTVPAMAVTLVIFTAVQFAMRALRQYLVAPLHAIVPVDAINGVSITMRSGGSGSLSLAPAADNIPGAWIYSTQVVNAAGHPVQSLPLSSAGGLSVQACGANGGRGPSPACFAELAQHGFHNLVTYQPASRFWLFQGYETAIYVALAVGLAAVCVWCIRRRIA